VLLDQAKELAQALISWDLKDRGNSDPEALSKAALIAVLSQQEILATVISFLTSSLKETKRRCFRVVRRNLEV